MCRSFGILPARHSPRAGVSLPGTGCRSSDGGSRATATATTTTTTNNNNNHNHNHTKNSHNSHNNSKQQQQQQHQQQRAPHQAAERAALSGLQHELDVPDQREVERQRAIGGRDFDHPLVLVVPLREHLLRLCDRSEQLLRQRKANHALRPVRTQRTAEAQKSGRVCSPSSTVPAASICSRAGWVSMLLHESLRNAVQPRSSRTHSRLRVQPLPLGLRGEPVA